MHFSEGSVKEIVLPNFEETVAALAAVQHGIPEDEPDTALSLALVEETRRQVHGSSNMPLPTFVGEDAQNIVDSLQRIAEEEQSPYQATARRMLADAFSDLPSSYTRDDQKIAVPSRKIDTPPKTTYEEYLAEGNLQLESAALNEQILGLDATVDLYRAAGIQFLGAIGSRPVRAGANDIEEPDPILLLQYATCLAKQAESTYVEPYQSEESRGHDRRADLKRIARKTFREAWDSIVAADEQAGETTMPDEVLVNAAFVTAEGLNSIHKLPEAKLVFEQARRLLAIRESDPDLIYFIDEHTRTPERQRRFTRKEVAQEAVLGLTTDAHQVLHMAA